MSGSVTSGVHSTLPDLFFIIGNDLAGRKFLGDPTFVENPSYLSGTEELEKVILCIFPACAVTRSMSKRSSEGVFRNWS